MSLLQRVERAQQALKESEAAAANGANGTSAAAPTDDPPDIDTPAAPGQALGRGRHHGARYTVWTGRRTGVPELGEGGLRGAAAPLSRGA